MFRCLPERLRQVQLQQEVLRQVIAPPPTDIRSTVYTLGGVDVTSPGMGLLTAAQIVQGSFFSLDPQEEVVLDEAYAHQKRLDIGSTQVINGIRFKVVGLAQPPLGGMTSDVYVPLADLQQLSHRTGRINVIMIRVSNASQVERLSREVADAFPEARVASAKTLALQVTGSLVDVSRLTDRVGRVLALAVLAAAFGLAGVLTLSSVGRRVRELGTLRAVGWRTAWVVRQILGEALLLGLLGGIVGIGLGGVAALAVGRLAPSLDAIATPPAWAQPLARPPIHQTIRLEPRLDVVMMPLAAGLAIVGGLVAGTVGSISAARLRPGEALRYLE
jgi:ABC-type antimicrobial peptide transport system permease subunit